jgi:phosphonate transport system permease protein
LGPFTGVLALAFASVGSLSRVYAEAIEQIDPQQVMALRASGAGSIQTFIYAVIPQALPLLISYSIVYFESNVRHATILGYVGAGGVGYKLFEYIGTSAYTKLLGTAIILVVAVTIIDRFSNALRKRFI